MLNTIFLWLRPWIFQSIPRNTGLFMMLFWPLRAHTSAEYKGRFPLPAPANGTLKVSGKRVVATAIFQRGQGENDGLGFNNGTNDIVRCGPVREHN